MDLAGRHVRLSVRMEQLGSHWADFYEIWYLNISRKSVEKSQVLLKSDKSAGHFTRRHTHSCDYISLTSSWKENLRQKL